MSYNVFPFGGRPAGGPRRGRGMAEIVDLATRRADVVAAPPMPDEVWAEIDAADRSWQRLRDDGREVLFEPPRTGGRIRATLRDVRSGAERALPLTELFGPRDDGPPTAA